MHLHVPHKPAWGVILAITVVAWPLGGLEFFRMMQILRARSLPVAQGQVLQREEINNWCGLPVAKLTLREAIRGDNVFAVMPNYTADKFGTAVQFHYSGDPRKLVHLVGEDVPLWLIPSLWGVPLLLWVVFFTLKRSPRYRSMVE